MCVVSGSACVRGSVVWGCWVLWVWGCFRRGCLFEWCISGCWESAKLMLAWSFDGWFSSQSQRADGPEMTAAFGDHSNVTRTHKTNTTASSFAFTDTRGMGDVIFQCISEYLRASTFLLLKQRNCSWHWCIQSPTSFHWTQQKPGSPIFNLLSLLGIFNPVTGGGVAPHPSLNVRDSIFLAQRSQTMIQEKMQVNELSIKSPPHLRHSASPPVHSVNSNNVNLSNWNHPSGQISIIPKPELRGFGGIPLLNHNLRWPRLTSL